MGWDYNGINWNGTWLSTWGSPTGQYSGYIYVSASGQVGEVSGAYDNGTMKGYSYYVLEFGAVKSLRFKGRWERTRGDSGGPCQYGLFMLDLIASGTDPWGYPNTAFTGSWTYCDADPEGLAERWLWTGSELR
ncbi:hypothetical protein [Nannocystis punicea]|uniref:Uncharacterized protein n=1 Tax=Nannocystis punicea TaxID=2995304 RepID=A0ABY7HJ31_9BACT|nr:hypothetical protein [Nannocystis poenicansa]WAS99314.1 hypothetical protein O0S08_24565 [Nannocystis poenicansa]